MTEIPIKTRHRILRQSRMLIASGKEDFIHQAVWKSYPKLFKSMSILRILHRLPELRKRYSAYESLTFGTRQDKVNLLSDAINEINAKIKAEAANSSAVAQGDRKPSRREKAMYNANQR